VTAGRSSLAQRALGAALVVANVLLVPAYPLLVAWPALAGIPVLLFGGLFAASRRKIALAAGLVWLLYLLYEYAMKLRLLCSGECNIRVDLLLIYPALVALSAAGSVAAAKAWRATR
jgi:hypothetical protein